MGVSGFAELNAHHGHEIVVVRYGPEDDPVNVAIECETCNVVLLDYNADPEDDGGVAWKGTPAVSATAHSDDHALEITFDATRWLAQAGPEEIVALAECDFGGDYAADAVLTDSAAWDPECRRLQDYLAAEPRMANGDSVGFEVFVDDEQAPAWLAVHRPDLFARLEED